MWRELLEGLSQLSGAVANFALAHNQLAQAYLAKHINDEAVTELQRAVQLSGGSPLEQGICALACKRWPKSRSPIHCVCVMHGSTFQSALRQPQAITHGIQRSKSLRYRSTRYHCFHLPMKLRVENMRFSPHAFQVM